MMEQEQMQKQKRKKKQEQKPKLEFSPEKVFEVKKDDLKDLDVDIARYKAQKGEGGDRGQD